MEALWVPLIIDKNVLLHNRQAFQTILIVILIFFGNEIKNKIILGFITLEHFQVQTV
jgi:hypothetical protein